MNGLIAFLALPLLLPMGLLFLLKGVAALRSGRFQLYWADFEGRAGRMVGSASVFAGLVLLGCCGILLDGAIRP